MVSSMVLKAAATSAETWEEGILVVGWFWGEICPADAGFARDAEFYYWRGESRWKGGKGLEMRGREKGRPMAKKYINIISGGGLSC
jgi:hypothetical protein